MLKIRRIFNYKVIIGILVLLALALTSFKNYLLFHSLVEIFSIVIACGVFMLIWNSRRFVDNDFFIVVGVGFLFVGGLDFIHLLAYKGVGVFGNINSDLSVQLWLAARFVEAGTLVAAPFFTRRKVFLPTVVIVFAGASILLVLSIVKGIFPHAFLEASGLTNFKIVSEYVISAVIAAGIVLIYRRCRKFDPRVLRLIIWSMALTVVSEIFFTRYASVFGISNMIGHLIKIVAFALFYEAIIVTVVVNPFKILFRNLKESEVSLRKEVEERTQVQKQLEVSMKSQDDFLFQTIHDLRTPLSVIKLVLELYEPRDPNKQNREFDKDVHLIEKANTQMNRLISNLFSIASGEKNEIAFTKEKVDIFASVSGVLGQLEPLLAKKRIAVNLNQPPKPAIVIADPGKLEEILLNILDNAVKYNREGGSIEIDYQFANGAVKTSIRDTGIGISEEEMPKLFKPYFRSDAVRRIEGTGLGLYIVKKLIEKMGGQVEAVSEKEKGTTISISLPRG